MVVADNKVTIDSKFLQQLGGGGGGVFPRYTRRFYLKIMADMANIISQTSR